MLRESLNILCKTSVFLISREESFLSIHEHLGGYLSLSHKPRACCGSCPKAVKELLGSCSPGSVMQRRTCLHSSAAQPDLGRRGKAVPLLGTKEEGRRVTQESWWPSCHPWDQPGHGMGGATPRYSPTSENEAMLFVAQMHFLF